MRRHLAAITLGASLLAATAGCGDTASEPSARDTAQSSTSSGADQGVVLTAEGSKLLAQLSSTIDYKVWASASELTRDAPVVLTGTVDEVMPGREIVTAEEGGTSSRDTTVVVRIKVDKEAKVGPGVADDGLAYVSVPRGLDLVDSEGKVVGPSSNPSLEDFQRTIPKGLRVVAISWPQEVPIDNPKVQRVGVDPNPVPKGATLLQGMHPQTITFDQGEDELDYWAGYTFEKFLAEVTE